MAKNLLSGILLLILFSCGNSDNNEKNAGTDNTPATEVMDTNAANPDYKAGKDLVSKYQCVSCHRVDEGLTGPSYREVAVKYAGAGDTIIDRLAKKVIKGGSGVWGEIPMTAHPNVSEENAKTMVKYILLLKE